MRCVAKEDIKTNKQKISAAVSADGRRRCRRRAADWPGLEPPSTSVGRALPGRSSAAPLRRYAPGREVRAVLHSASEAAIRRRPLNVRYPRRPRRRQYLLVWYFGREPSATLRQTQGPRLHEQNKTSKFRRDKFDT